MPAAYQDENGKWYKQCSTTKQVFGPVDTKEEFGEWFGKGDGKDGFRSCCKEVTNKRQQQYDQENAYKLKEYKKQYYKKNVYKLNETKRRYREKNSDKIKEAKRRYRKENSDKIRHYNQTAAGLFGKYKRSAKHRNINFTLTLEWFEEQITKPEFNICAISGIEFVEANGNPNEPFSRSLDRIDSTKGYTPDNLAWVCYRYNSWKCDLSHEEIKMMYEYSSKHNSVSSTT